MKLKQVDRIFAFVVVAFCDVLLCPKNKRKYDGGSWV